MLWSVEQSFQESIIGSQSDFRGKLNFDEGHLTVSNPKT